MDVLQGINLAIRFVVELVALLALGWWGFRYGKTALQQYGLAMLAPLSGAALWSLFIAPNAPVDVGFVLRFILQLVVFGAATLALVLVHQRTLGLIFASVVALNGALLVLLDH